MKFKQHLLIAFLTCLILSSLSCSSKHPSDASMAANFQSHKTEFEELLQMFKGDKGLGRVAYDFTRPANPGEVGVSPQRLVEYRRLFDRLKLSAGVEGYGDKDQVWFIASTQGLSVSGSSKGFAYLTKPPSLQVVELDGYRSADGKSFQAFRHIEGNWYLYLDYED
jgi:hypothetical protein